MNELVSEYGQLNVPKICIQKSDSMNQLDEFCNEYLPQYFLMKYKAGNIKREFFEYKNQKNVFELTAMIFSLVDQLHAANPLLHPTKIVDNYFSFRFSDFSAVCKENELRDEKSENHVTQAIRKILKRMQDVIYLFYSQHHRECFQIFIRLIYLYFDSKEIQNTGDLKRKQNQKEYFQSFISLYKDLRLKTQLSSISLVPCHFMDYAIDLLLNMKPNKKFIDTIKQITKQCEFPEIIQEKIFNRIKEIQLKFIFNSHKIQIQHTENPSSGNKSSLDSQTKIDSNQGTPVKEEQISQKNQRKTLQTSEKKYNMIFKNPQDRSTLDSLKTSLMLQRKPSTTSKERTIYNCTKYLVPKKTLLTPSVNTPASSISYIQEMRFSELNRSFRTRFLEATSCEDEGFLAGSTPKPKKKIKTENTLIRPPFDQKGNFIYKN